MSRQNPPDTVNPMLTGTLSDRAHAVVAHLLTDPYGDHHAGTVSAATGMPIGHVYSSFALLVAQGWAVHRDGGGNTRPITLTSVGRMNGEALVESGVVGVPLAVLDREDPKAADLVRARMGWAPRHA